jgi:hypothetical protein
LGAATLVGYAALVRATSGCGIFGKKYAMHFLPKTLPLHIPRRVQQWYYYWAKYALII